MRLPLLPLPLYYGQSIQPAFLLLLRSGITTDHPVIGAPAVHTQLAVFPSSMLKPPGHPVPHVPRQSILVCFPHLFPGLLTPFDGPNGALLPFLVLISIYSRGGVCSALLGVVLLRPLASSEGGWRSCSIGVGWISWISRLCFHSIVPSPIFQGLLHRFILPACL